MLNEQRVKQMVKLATYESGGGSEEIKISSYPRKSYLKRNLWRSAFWATAAYFALMCFLGWGLLGEAVENMSEIQVTAMVISVTGIYLVVLVYYLVMARQYYKNKHARAYFHVKQFKKDLAELERMYEKEDRNGKNV